MGKGKSRGADHAGKAWAVRNWGTGFLGEVRSGLYPGELRQVFLGQQFCPGVFAVGLTESAGQGRRSRSNGL